MAQVIHTRLRQSEEGKQKIEAILKNMSDGLILTDTRGTILMTNDALKNLFKVEASIEGKTLMEGLRNAELMEMIESVVDNEEKISRETELSYPKELHLMVAASPFYTYNPEKEMSGVVCTFHDITRLKKLEEIRKDFVANVSHEIKTPITAIKGFTETLLDGALDDRENAQKFLETIKHHSERLNSLVSDLLTLSRIELGDVPIEKKHVNFEEIVDTVFATLREKATGKGLTLTKQLEKAIMKIHADRDRLIQILLNLVDNGIKYTEQGGVTIRTTQEKYLDQHGEEQKVNVISVVDTGVGIPRKNLARLGERFYRVDRARSRALGGTGLGLAIVKHLVKAHAWQMEFESTEGAGTTVRIVFPAAD
jgi:two-component system phosphate regulon sensor histidine kinase PhoR